MKRRHVDVTIIRSFITSCFHVSYRPTYVAWQQAFVMLRKSQDGDTDELSFFVFTISLLGNNRVK